MNPTGFLREGGYPIAVLTTYSFDPVFFERIVLPELWAGGSGSVIVFVDESELRRSLDVVVGGLRHMGRRYLLQPIRMDGAFHPKVFLRLGPDGGLAWIGSNNLTRGGWGANSELASAWQLGTGNHAWVSRLLDDLRSRTPHPLTRQLLDRILGLPWLDRGLDYEAGTVLVTPPESLRSQLERRWGGRRFTSLKVLTGSTDPDGAMLRWAVERFGIEAVQLCVTPERTSFHLSELQSIEAEIRFFPPPEDKILHAKFYWFDGPEGPAVVWGSANCSRAAWLLDGHNFEAVVVDDTPKPSAYAHVLGAFEQDGSDPSSVLSAEPTLVDTPARTGVGPLRIVRAQADSAGSVEVELDRPLEPSVTVWLQLRDTRARLTGMGNVWKAVLGIEGLRSQTEIVRVVVEGLDPPRQVSLPHWLDREDELREVLAGRDFRSSMERLRTYESNAADYRLAHELGKIGLELLTDTSAYPDRHPKAIENTKDPIAARSKVDPEALLISLGEVPGRDFPSGPSSGGLVSISGVFRALFGRYDDEGDAEVIEEGHDVEDEGGWASEGDDTVPSGNLVSESSETERKGEPHSNEKARKILHGHMEKFFTRFAAPEFGRSCSAVQFTQASAYPIAVALMGRSRGWSSEEDASNWSRRVLDLLLRSDRFHEREALLDTVRRRFETEGTAEQFEAAVGDGQLWLTLLVACDMVSGASMQALLTKSAIFRAFIERIDLVASTDPAALRQLFRRFYDLDALTAAQMRVAELGGSLRRLENQLRSRYAALKEGQRTGPLLFRCGDVVWSPKGGWGIAEEDEEAALVRVFVVQAGEMRQFKADGWLVNVARLQENPAADEVIRHLAYGLLRTITTEGGSST